MSLDISKFDKNRKINTISEWDSFNNLMLISRLQDEFHIEFTASEIEATQTIASLLALVNKKAKK